MKEKINFYLDLYQQEISNLIFESTFLYEQLESKPAAYWDQAQDEYDKIVESIVEIETSKDALLECKNDCIADL